ncbi:putative ribonuclease H-like domain-containing protein [Tanacetum coccineum]|uniref:Ribonuclease H-like domain-containing protein n=1 Tax=Tanacetum coccineum TaxID=301880 RepID=A0ABQ5ARA1_9ASTR
MVEKTIWNNARRINHQNSQRLTHPHPKGNFVPKAVLMKSGIKTLNNTGQNFSKVAVSVNTARLINTAYPRPTVNSARTASNIFIRAHTHVRRPFNKSTTNKNSNLKEKVNTVKGNVTTTRPKAVVSDNKGNEANVVKALACWLWRPKQKVLDHVSRQNVASVNFKRFDYGNPQLELQEKGVIDSGCYRHMTGNKSYLSDYEEIDGGFIAFRGDPKGGRITGKGKISTDALTISMNYKPVVTGFACFLSQVEPKKVIQALTDPSWIEAMQDELLQFKLQKVWTLVDLPYGKRAIGTKWVYRNKKDERGIVVRNKARLVAQGYTQEEGIDYDEVFAPVARIEAIRLFLAYASFMNFVVYQMDVKSAFLYGKIEEEVYVCQPLGFEDPEFPDRVYKVEKALYGLHQAPRAWYETLSTYLLENGFQRGTIDKTLFIKKVMQKEDGIFISQDKYVDEILKKFGFSTVRIASTPMKTSKPLLKDAEAEDVYVHLYRLMIGSLMYLTASRHDIMFVVCACARFQVTPKVSHLHAVKRIFRYLKGQPKLGLWYPKTLQTIVANSTTEAEYVAAANCCGQVLWIQNQMLDYGYNFMNTKIFIDNESTICIVKNPVFHSKTKHIEIRHHFIRDSYEKRLIQVIKIHTDHNVADLLIKALDVSRFQFLTASIGMLNL